MEGKTKSLCGGARYCYISCHREVSYSSIYWPSLAPLWHALHGLVASQEEKLAMQNAAQDAGDGAAADQDGHGIGCQLLESADLMNALKSSGQGAVRAIRGRALEALRGTTAEVLQFCSQSIKLAAQCIHTVNTCRWICKPLQQNFDELARATHDTLATLRSARAVCVTNTTENVLERYADLFGENGQLKFPRSLDPASLREIIISMVIK
ncbi:hypothetical protein B0T10DRAFT_586060 [Thelonectria olida]|uniref:Uncharacterized protein n=1 Tax=Thelonectria olida TaxID=1576542 RepID=A0A9P8VVL6_9HYPO|nr:hypothetical protein B0T10DRAFT_586060 [Thelonectria olida]